MTINRKINDSIYDLGVDIQQLTGIAARIYHPITFQSIPFITLDSQLGIDIGSEVKFEKIYLEV